MECSKEKSEKKKRLAPLNKKTETPEISATPPIDEFEFTEEMLDEIFSNEEKTGSVNERLGKSPNTTLIQPAGKTGELLDLDDWIPKSIKAVKATTSPAPTVVPVRSQKNSTHKSLPVNNRKELFFSSHESEPDSTLGLRFTKRHVPASKLKSLSESHTKVSLYQAPKYSESKEWFTYGVVCARDVLKKPGSGRMDVTDLSSEPYSVRFLLFGSAFSEFGKVPVGSIVCITKPVKGKPAPGGQTEAMLIYNAEQIFVAGISRDFGMCGGTKKAGGACRAVVNMSICRFCKFHALAEYKQKQIAKDIKAAAAGVGLNSSKTGLWNAQATQAKFLNPAKRNLTMMKKDSEKLNKLNQPTSSSKPSTSNTTSNASLNANRGTSDSLPSKSPTTTTLLPKFDHEALKAAAEARHSLFSQKRKLEVSPETESSSQKTQKSVSNKLTSTPSPESSTRVSAAKRRALNFVRENGALAKDKPKAVIQPNSDVPEKSKPIGLTDEFLEMMNRKPRDPKLLKVAEALEQDKRFEKLALAEEVSEKLIKTHMLPTKALRCLACKKNYFQMPLQCVMNKHECRVVMGNKRFFECNGCRTRTTTLERMPGSECGKCGVWSWKRCGLAPDRVCSAAPQLAVRGLEEKHVNSVVKDPNLNLLVPDDA